VIFFTCVAPRPVRPNTVTTQEIIDEIHELISEDRWPDFGLNNSWGTEQFTWAGWVYHSWKCGHADHFAKWVPIILNANKQRHNRQFSEQNLEFFGRDANNFPSCLVCLEWIWFCDYYPKIKQQWLLWLHSVSPCAKIFRFQKSGGKFLTSVFLYPVGILHTDYLRKGQPNKDDYY
jgi:hypothetical protein